jgi:hypothetical protein
MKIKQLMLRLAKNKKDTPKIFPGRIVELEGAETWMGSEPKGHDETYAEMKSGLKNSDLKLLQN